MMIFSASDGDLDLLRCLEQTLVFVFREVPQPNIVLVETSRDVRGGFGRLKLVPELRLSNVL